MFYVGYVKKLGSNACLVPTYLPTWATSTTFKNSLTVWQCRKNSLVLQGEISAYSEEKSVCSLALIHALLTQTIVSTSPLLFLHTEYGKLGKCRQRPYCDELTHRFWVEDKRERNNGTMNPHFHKA